jgi:hypothetical protein
MDAKTKIESGSEKKVSLKIRKLEKLETTYVREIGG